jgi:hypothetical protein
VSQHRKPCRPVSRSRGGFDGDGCQGATFTSRRGPGPQDNLAAKYAGIDALVHIVRSRERQAVDDDGMDGAVAQQAEQRGHIGLELLQVRQPAVGNAVPSRVTAAEKEAQRAPQFEAGQAAGTPESRITLLYIGHMQLSGSLR